MFDASKPKDSVRYMAKLVEEMTPQALDVYIDDTTLASSHKDNVWNMTLTSNAPINTDFTIVSGTMQSKLNLSPVASPTGQ